MPSPQTIENTQGFRMERKPPEGSINEVESLTTSIGQALTQARAMSWAEQRDLEMTQATLNERDHIQHHQEMEKDPNFTQYLDCPAMDTRELTVRVLEIANRMHSMHYNSREELEALERRVGEQFMEWSTYVGQTVDKITEKMDHAERRERVERQQREAALMRHFQAYDEQLSILGDRYRAQTQSTEKMGEDLRLGLAMIASNVSALEKTSRDCLASLLQSSNLLGRGI